MSQIASIQKAQVALGHSMLPSQIPQTSPINSRLLIPDQNLVRKLLEQEKDERYRYLLRLGNIHYIEADTFTIYVELP